MQDIWEILSENNLDQRIDRLKCNSLIFNTNSVAEIRSYLEDLLERLEDGDEQVVDEVWSVGVPLSYRLAIDDTSKNYRISSLLKEKAIRKTHPIMMKLIEDEIDYFSRQILQVRYSDLSLIKETVIEQLRKFTLTLDGNWIVYGRVKMISSILSKLSKFKTGMKSPKTNNISIEIKISDFLQAFENNVMIREKGSGSLSRINYDYETLKWLLPDLLAFTIQLSDDRMLIKNMGAAKSKYRSVFQKLKRILPVNVYYGPDYSDAWHMNRMVCYLDYPFGSNKTLPIELFVRTDIDYFIGYGNYWRYKGFKLFANKELESNIYQSEFNKKVKDCRNFNQVQDILYKEVSTGQLELF